MCHVGQSPAVGGQSNPLPVAVSTLYVHTSRSTRGRTGPRSVLWQVCEAGQTAQGAFVAGCSLRKNPDLGTRTYVLWYADGRSSCVHRRYSTPWPQVRAIVVAQSSFSYSTQNLCRFAAIYDGHEGSQAATYLAAYLHNEIKSGLAPYTAGHVHRFVES